MTRRFDAVLFDFGGVIVTSPFDLIGQAGRHTGVEPEVVLEVIMGDYAEDNDHPWHRLERGEISMHEYGAFLISTLAERKIDLDLSKLGSFYGQLEVYPAMVETVRRLRQEGYRTALVTNNARETGDAWRSMVPLDELFEVVIDSCQVGVRKPNRAIYELALAELGGIAPDRAVFLDDAEGNIEGARRAGLAAILVQDPETAIAELDALLAHGEERTM